VRNYFGDARRPDLLAAAGIAEAQILIVAIDDREGIDQIVEYATSTYPDLHVIGRAVDRDHVYDLWFKGCRDIIRETYDSSLRIGRSAIEAMGEDHETAEAIVAAFNEQDRKAMLAIAEVHQTGVAPHENEAYVARVKEMRSDWEENLTARIAEIRAGG
jgi:CPA2 family monovalent cation:H+ antiporter-2